MCVQMTIIQSSVCIHSIISLDSNHEITSRYYYSHFFFSVDEAEEVKRFAKVRTVRWCSGKESACQCRRCSRRGFDPWVWKIPWRRKWQPTLVFLPRKSHGWRSLVGCSPWGCKRVRHDLATQQQQQHRWNQEGTEGKTTSKIGLGPMGLRGNSFSVNLNACLSSVLI